MMKRLFIILALLVCGPVLAEHHRGHALGYLEQIAPKVEIVEQWSVAFASQAVPTTHEWQLVYEGPGEVSGIFPGNIEGIKIRAQQAIAALSGEFHPMCYQLGLEPGPGQDLECARRFINQPNNHIGVRSLLQFCTSAMYGQTIFALWDEGCDSTGQWCSDENQSILLGHVNMIWAAAQQAAWHINDAIREETYGDPDFAE